MRKTLRNILLNSLLSVSLSFNSCNLPYPYLEKDGSYDGVVIFAYTTEQISKEKRDYQFYELTNNSLHNGELQESVESWYKNKAEDYGKSIDIPLNLYEKDIKIPEDFISANKFPLDIINFTKYLRKNYPELNNYDFLSIIYQMDFEGSKTISYAYPSGKSFVLRYLNPTKEKILFSNNPSFAHEVAHLLGATDKYENRPEIEELDIMKQGGVQEVLNENILITKQTAKEIGW